MKEAYDKLQKESCQMRIYETVPFGILLAIVGGLLDAYTYIGRNGVFANAQTGNIVLLGIHASEGDWKKALMYVPPILAFILGVIFVEIIKKLSPRLFGLDWVQMILMLEVVVLFILGFVPADFPDIMVTVTISFIASVQVCSFSKLVDSSYATTMMTGNLRSFSQALYRAIAAKDPEAKARAVRYILVIISFVIGAVIGGALTILTGVRAIWGAVMILLVCIAIVGLSGYSNSRKAL